MVSALYEHKIQFNLESLSRVWAVKQFMNDRKNSYCHQPKLWTRRDRILSDVGNIRVRSTASVQRNPMLKQRQYITGKKIDPVTLTFDLWYLKLIGFQIFHRNILIIPVDCSHRCHRRTNWRTFALLYYPYNNAGERIHNMFERKNMEYMPGRHNLHLFWIVHCIISH